MRINFAKAAARIEATLETGQGAMTSTGIDGEDAQRTSPTLQDRPTISQPDVHTDSLDPAAESGPAPFNSGAGPYGQPVVDDPLTSAPIRPGSPIPHVLGPDLDTTTLR